MVRFLPDRHVSDAERLAWAEAEVDGLRHRLSVATTSLTKAEARLAVREVVAYAALVLGAVGWLVVACSWYFEVPL